jgi:hypothetical protein
MEVKRPTAEHALQLRSTKEDVSQVTQELGTKEDPTEADIDAELHQAGLMQHGFRRSLCRSFGFNKSKRELISSAVVNNDAAAP